MNTILTDFRENWLNLLPLSFTRPISKFRIGIFCIDEKWEKYLGSNCSYFTEDFLTEKYPAKITDDNFIINSIVLPDKILAEKIDRCLENSIFPIFCCGESLQIRESGKQNEFVATQLSESLFHLTTDEMRGVIIAYEPIWAIGTGKTATTEQAQEMHAHLRSVLAGRYGDGLANEIPILYGGSVKANNAKELFSCPDVDGGLVGGASLVAADFIEIIRALKE